MNSQKLLMAKARGLTISIGRMSGSSREHKPSGAFADDYNRLLQATRQAFPALLPLLPPVVTTFRGGGGDMYSDLSFNEIDAFCEQIFQLVAEAEDAT